MMRIIGCGGKGGWAGTVLLVLALVHAGCTTMGGTWDDGLPKDNLAIEERLWHIVFPLSVAAAEHCAFKREETYGFFLESSAEMSRGDRKELGPLPAKVRYVHATLPAGAAGMAIGDVITAINGSSVAAQSAEVIRAQIERLTRARIQPLTLRLMRSGMEHEVHLRAVPSCRMTVKVVESPVINAMSDGSNIVVTSGLLRFVRSPDQLAWVLAHEVGHHALEHAERSRLQVTLNRLLSSMGEEMSPTLEQIDLERQADLFAADLAVRAGFDLREARRFLQRVQTLEGQGLSRTHPTTQERLVGLDRLIEAHERHENSLRRR